MRKSKFTEEQIIGLLKRAEAGMAVAEICRNGGFSDAMFYKWRAKFGGLGAENAKAQAPAGRGSPGHAGTQERARCKEIAPQAKLAAITQLIQDHQLSERRARRLVGLSRDSYRHPPVSSPQTRALKARIVEIAHVPRRFGYRRVHALTFNPGLLPNHWYGKRGQISSAVTYAVVSAAHPITH